jgi:hypothetical protein
MTSELPPHAAGAGDRPGTGTAELIGYGRLRWDELTSMIGDAPAAWADYDGFHIGLACEEPPPYSHLWAWTAQWLIRARIEGDTAVVGALILASPPAGAPPALMREQVTYERAAARTWPVQERRVGRLAPDVADRNVEIFLVAGERPVTFVAAGTGA